MNLLGIALKNATMLKKEEMSICIKSLPPPGRI